MVTIRSSVSTSVPSAAITCTMQRRTDSSPSVGPYCSAAALESTATRDISIAKSSAGNVVVSGRPVASEMTSGRAVTAIMSRIAEDVMPRVRRANSSP